MNDLKLEWPLGARVVSKALPAGQERARHIGIVTDVIESWGDVGNTTHLRVEFAKPVTLAFGNHTTPDVIPVEVDMLPEQLEVLPLSVVKFNAA